jgi:putative transposase
MSKMYWQLYYHIVWATKGRQPIISEEVQDTIVRYVQAKCDEMGCVLHAAGAASDHEHILVSIPPDVRISDFLRDVKGGSSHLINHEMALDTPFYWQRGCGVISISNRDKARVTDYVRNQRKKHGTGDLWPSLERSGADTEDDDPA